MPSPNPEQRFAPVPSPWDCCAGWGQRYLLASLVLPLYREDGGSSPRTLPVPFVECPGVRKPGRKATDAQIDQYREEKKKRRLSVCFVEEARKRKLPKWRRKAKRPSCQDLITLLRKQVAAEREPESTVEQMIMTAAA